MKKVILFDFFGVISSEVAPVWFAKHFSKKQAIAIKNKISGKADIGAITIDEMFEEISLVSGKDTAIIKQEWFDLAVINTELVDFIKSINCKYKVYLLSNAISDFIFPVLKKNNLEILFEKIYISSEIRRVKPTREFFDYCLKDANLNPSEAIFIDDNIDNVKGAQEAGIDGVLFENNIKFYEDFTRFFG